MAQHFSTIFLSLAIILQFGTVLLALKLIKITDTARGWILISISLLLMGLRRIIAIAYLHIFGLDLHFSAVQEDFVTFLTSITMLLGVYFLSDVFREKKRNEIELKEMKEFNENILDTIWTGVLVVDKEENVFFINKSIEKILEHMNAPIIGMNIFDFIDQIIADNGHLKNIFIGEPPAKLI